MCWCVCVCLCATGLLSAGNPSNYVPIILAEITPGSRHQYLLLHSLREVNCRKYRSTHMLPEGHSRSQVPPPLFSGWERHSTCHSIHAKSNEYESLCTISVKVWSFSLHKKSDELKLTILLCFLLDQTFLAFAAVSAPRIVK